MNVYNFYIKGITHLKMKKIKRKIEREVGRERWRKEGKKEV